MMPPFPKRLSSRILLLLGVSVACLFLYQNNNDWTNLKDLSTEKLEEKQQTLGLTALKSLELIEIHKGIFKEEQSSVEISTTEMSGMNRAKYLQQACERLKQKPSRYKMYTKTSVRVSYSGKHNTIYCPLCKLASTFWTRVYVMLNKNTDKHIVAKTPFDIPISQAPASKQWYNLGSHKVTPDNKYASDAFKYLFVRSPYAFLYSAFVDKLVAPSPGMWNAYGVPAIERLRHIKSSTCGSDVTFEEFVDYSVSIILRTGRPRDCHTAKFTECSPCAMNYTYVAQMETFAADTFNILTHLNQTNTINIFKTRFKDLHAEDAIEDTLGPFNDKESITKCIPWPQALRRMWRKLQLRGIIGLAPFPLTDAQAMEIDKPAFVALAKQAQKLTSSSEKKTVKTEGFNEAYSSLSDDLIQKLHKAYQEEMDLFGYRMMNLTATRSLVRSNTYRNYFNYEKDLEKC